VQLVMVRRMNNLRSDGITGDNRYVWDSFERSEVGGIEWLRELFAHSSDACFRVWRHGERGFEVIQAEDTCQ